VSNFFGSLAVRLVLLRGKPSLLGAGEGDPVADAHRAQCRTKMLDRILGIG
jgi:hypothetical protein